MNLIYKNMLLAQGIEALLVGPFEFQDEGQSRICRVLF